MRFDPTRMRHFYARCSQNQRQFNPGVVLANYRKSAPCPIHSRVLLREWVGR